MTLIPWLRSRESRRSRTSTRGPATRCPLWLEALEDRIQPSAYVVTTTADSGPGSLRDAITQINADTSHVCYASPSNASVDEIDFNITAASDTGGAFDPGTKVATITPQSALPTITNAVFIDSYTQSGASANTLTVGDNAVLKIDLSGTQSGSSNGFIGLTVAAAGCTVRGLAVNGFAYTQGIQVQGGDTIEGNFIGTDVTGTQVVGNVIGVDSYGLNNVIGGTTPDARNIISGNGLSPAIPNSPTAASGIFARGTGELIEGNYIGTDATGTIALGNGPTQTNYGGGAIYVSEDADASGTTIGGTAPGAGNLISGNAVGINATNFKSGPLPVIQGNLIGTDATGTQALGNYIGINTDGPFLIGGTTPSTRNIISGNYVGISGGGVIEGNYIGTDITGTMAVSNGSENGIWLHGGLVGGTDPGAGNVISGNGIGIRIFGGGCQIEGNLIGTDATGTQAIRNGDGIFALDSGANNNVIGGTTAAARNVISGNSNGISVGASGNVIEGDYIGTDITGTRAIGNSNGVNLTNGASHNTIGGTTATARNIISGKGNAGVIMADESGGTGLNLPSNNMVEGNYIGIDVGGSVALGNGTGVLINNAGGNHAVENNLIGGTVSGAGNVISGNGPGAGINIDTVTGNSVFGNSIYSNAGGGIRLGDGANNNQTAPVLSSALSSSTGTAISGTLAGYPSTSFRIEFFSNQTPDPSGYGEGQTFLGFAQVNTDSSGNFSANLPTALPPGTLISATATDANGNTSMFAADITVKGVLTVNTNSSIMLVGNNPPPLTGSVNDTPFTSPFMYTTQWGDVITMTLNTVATSASPVGQYSIGASKAGSNSGNYVLNVMTPSTMYVVSLGADPNGSGAQAVTFWDNKGDAKFITVADLSSLDALNLVNQGGAAFDPKSVAQLQAWLSVSPNATTAYQLAVQLAAMDLNVLSGYVHATDLVYAGALLPFASAYGITGLTSGGFIDVQNLMSAANTILAQVSPGVPSGDPNQAYEAALAQVLLTADANSDFVTQELLWGLVGAFV
jgi:hypothetical protein